MASCDVSKWRRDDGYVISTDPTRLDLPMIVDFLAQSYWAHGTPETLYVKYKPAKGLRILQQQFTPEQVLIKGLKAKGKQMASKSIARIEATQGRWWDKGVRSPKGILE